MSDAVRRGRAVDCKPWAAPQVGPGGHGATPGDIARLRQQAQEEGFQRGRAEGLEAGRQTISQLATRLEQIVSAMQEPLEAADDAVLQQVTNVAIAIARRLVRRELRTNRDEVVGVVREALAVLPLGLTNIRVHLHPEDARLVGEVLVPAEGEAAWQIVEDPVISRGGCRISSSTSQVDATVSTRLERVINSMLGGERDKDAGL
ncbi:MAG: flagellar assembly protein FliH [Gammaproteobacteria bacterium]|nr:flagellar assembly protein FliH [Gammaproteobacteria bacterium]NNF60057.1 flagellar assembly protein FliH [Gammaproteobacteria bacterium]NNM19988.1 flagellar assembly protein FliH [Gammaproteobacteria bacterium]